MRTGNLVPLVNLPGDLLPIVLSCNGSLQQDRRGVCTYVYNVTPFINIKDLYELNPIESFG